MSCKTVWSFDIVDLDGGYLDTCDICIEFSTKSMADMVICNGVHVYPKELRGVMFYLAKEEFGGYPKFRLEFQYYVSECRSEEGSEGQSENIEADYVADFTLCTDLVSINSNVSIDSDIEISDIDTDSSDEDESDTEEWL